jgi:hypothetical protein
MAILLTCNAANEGDPGEPIDLLGVGDFHGRNFIAYVELDMDEVIEAESSGLTLEAEAPLSGSMLLLIDYTPGSGHWLDQKLVWPLSRVPSGHWRLSLKIGGTERATRTVSIGEW